MQDISPVLKCNKNSARKRVTKELHSSITILPSPDQIIRDSRKSWRVDQAGFHGDECRRPFALLMVIPSIVLRFFERGFCATELSGMSARQGRSPARDRRPAVPCGPGLPPGGGRQRPCVAGCQYIS